MDRGILAALGRDDVEDFKSAIQLVVSDGIVRSVRI
jgi:hypothetical protein